MRVRTQFDLEQSRLHELIVASLQPIVRATPKSKSELPGYRHFYDAELERRVYDLYTEDFLLYGFSTTLGS